jgi:hypothetical protein
VELVGIVTESDADGGGEVGDVDGLVNVDNVFSLGVDLGCEDGDIP